MKLYNLYKDIILEAEIDSEEDDSVERAGNDEAETIKSYNGDVKSVIEKLIDGETHNNGNKFYRSARIWYRDIKTRTLEERYVFIYGKGTTKGGNPAVRAFQAFGGTKSGNSKWKIFLLPGTDKNGKRYGIEKIEVTDMKWYKPVDKLKGSDAPKYWGPNRDNSFKNGLEKGVTF
jgi:hypothetical protein